MPCPVPGCGSFFRVLPACSCHFQKVLQYPLSDAAALFRVELGAEEIAAGKDGTERPAVFRYGSGVFTDIGSIGMYIIYIASVFNACQEAA